MTAYHGTAVARLPSIVRNGLLVGGMCGCCVHQTRQVPGQLVTHRTDSGFWGRGIYLSPDPSVSIGYGLRDKLPQMALSQLIAVTHAFLDPSRLQRSVASSLCACSSAR